MDDDDYKKTVTSLFAIGIIIFIVPMFLFASCAFSAIDSCSASYDEYNSKSYVEKLADTAYIDDKYSIYD